MMRETVEVLDVRKGRATVKFSRKALCDSCKASSLCGSGSLEVVIDVGTQPLVKGDLIEIGIEESKTVLASLLVFFIPVIIFIAVLLSFKKKGEIASFLIGLSILTIYYIIIMLWIRRAPKKFDIDILRKL